MSGIIHTHYLSYSGTYFVPCTDRVLCTLCSSHSHRGKGEQIRDTSTIPVVVDTRSRTPGTRIHCAWHCMVNSPHCFCHRACRSKWKHPLLILVAVFLLDVDSRTGGKISLQEHTYIPTQVEYFARIHLRSSPPPSYATHTPPSPPHQPPPHTHTNSSPSPPPPHLKSKFARTMNTTRQVVSPRFYLSSHPRSSSSYLFIVWSPSSDEPPPLPPPSPPPLPSPRPIL